jgi:osmotically-inducible protein OsmY
MKNMSVTILLIASVNSCWALEKSAATAAQLASINEGQVPMVPPPYQMATLPAQSKADKKLSAKVQSELKTKLSNYNPEKNMIVAQKGSVILQGKVNSPEEAEKIVQVVRKVSGVSNIRNNMVVQSATPAN